jgi:Tol biopolymer transport system component
MLVRAGSFYLSSKRTLGRGTRPVPLTGNNTRHHLYLTVHRWQVASDTPIFSPDGRLIAYCSNESGAWEVYAQTFPLSYKKWPISTDGGRQPRWREDGREIYYLSQDLKLWACRLTQVRLLAFPSRCSRLKYRQA